MTARDVPVYAYESIDSTNTECARRLLSEGGMFVVTACTQTAGRGRQGHSFFSPPGAGLYMSLAMPEPAHGADGLTEYAAVCVCRAVRELFGISCGIKWVNDVYYRGKKVCGILCERVPMRGGGVGVIIGVGVNLMSSAEPPDLRYIAGSLGLGEPAAEPLRKKITSLLLCFDARDREFMDEYRALDILRGRRVSYEKNGRRREGCVAFIDECGRLAVRLPDGGLDLLDSGEVRLEEIEGIR